ncbi:MAG: hypothetical protein ACR2JB_09015 [Bryobacteraceae bacterium]
MSESKNPKRTGHKFERGNKHGRGRPEGSRNRATILLQQLMDDEAELIIRKVIELAKEGDSIAMKLAVERLIPPVKDRHIQLKFPRVHSAEDVIEASACLVQAVAEGNITPGEAHAVSGLLEIHRRSTETASLEKRISQLEAKVGDGERQP